MDDKNNLPILKKEAKRGTSFAVAGVILVGVAGFVYGYTNVENCSGTSGGAPLCEAWHWLFVSFYTIGGIFAGFVAGAVIGMIVDVFSSKK